MTKQTKPKRIHSSRSKKLILPVLRYKAPTLSLDSEEHTAKDAETQAQSAIAAWAEIPGGDSQSQFTQTYEALNTLRLKLAQHAADASDHLALLADVNALDVVRKIIRHL